MRSFPATMRRISTCPPAGLGIVDLGLGFRVYCGFRVLKRSWVQVQ